MNKTWTEKEALDLISKVESEFTAHLAQMQPLAKSEDESKDESKDEEKKDEKKADESKAEEMDCGDMKKAENKAAEQPSAKEETVEELYKSMSEEDKRAHYDALKKVMAVEEMKKSEVAAAPKEETKNDETSLLKSELEAVKAANAELKKSQEEIVAALAKRFAPKATAPKQKAITELGALNKSEQKDTETAMSDAQIRKILGQKAMDPSLKKSDRDLINAYCYNKVDVSAVKHLIG
jgi:hypothetical protein